MLRFGTRRATFCASILHLRLVSLSTVNAFSVITTLQPSSPWTPAAVLPGLFQSRACCLTPKRTFTSRRNGKEDDEDDKAGDANAAATTDEYDDWYADFDPAEFDEPDARFGSSNDENDKYNKKNRYSWQQRGRYTNKHDYQRDKFADNSNVDLDAINSLLSRRLQARKTRQFAEADALRDELLEQHGVRVNDREKLWRSGCSASGSGAQWGRGGDSSSGGRYGRGGDRRERGRGGGSRSFGPNGHDYLPCPSAGPNTSTLDEASIHSLLAERLECKLNREFRRADAIQDELYQAGVFVHDGRKEWRADGEGFGDYSSGGGGGGGGKPDREWGSGNDRRNRPYEQSPQCQAASSEDGEDGEKNIDVIQSLVDERMQAKLTRDYDTADAIREELRQDYNVAIDDRLRQWSVGGEFDGPSTQSERPFERARYSARTYSETEDKIQALVEERAEARLNRDFDTADAIRDELLQEYNVSVNDRKRLWSIGRGGTSGGAGGSGGGPAGYTQMGKSNLSEQEVATVEQLLQDRKDHQYNKQYGKADRIRDRLEREFQVRIDDRNQQWHVVTNEYTVSSESVDLDEETMAYVKAQVSKRAQAKLRRDYEEADAIRDELMDDYLISIDDRLKKWTALAGDEDEDGYDDDDDAGIEIDDDEVDEDDDNEIQADLDMDELVDSDEDTDEEDTDETVAVETDDGHGYVVVEEEDEEQDEEQDEEEPSSKLQANDNEVIAAGVQEDSQEEELNSLTVPALKDRLREAGLPVSGRKAELVERLLSASSPSR